jgi:heme-degrading monooxygenase HmoA
MRDRLAILNRDQRDPGATQARRRHPLAMICRIWHGRTPRDKADVYAAFLEARAIPDYRSVPGNLSVHVLRRDERDVTHFLTMTLWQSEDAIRAFAGDDLLTAKYYEEDRAFLLEFEPQVQHFVVESFATKEPETRVSGS